MTDLDLGFNPLQPRDPDGKWARGAHLARVLEAAPAGSTFEATHKDGFRLERPVTLTSSKSGQWSDDAATYAPKVAAALFGKGLVRTPADQRVHHDRVMNKRDSARLSNRKATPMNKRERALSAKRLLSLSTLTEQDVIDLSNFLGREIDLDWTKWNQSKKHVIGSKGPRQVNPHKVVTRRPGAGNPRAKQEIKAFKRSAGLKGASATLGKPAMAALKRRAAKSGHFRAKAILAASRGHENRAQKFQAASNAAVQARRAAAKVAGPKPPKASKPPKPPKTYPQHGSKPGPEGPKNSYYEPHHTNGPHGPHIGPGPRRPGARKPKTVRLR